MRLNAWLRSGIAGRPEENSIKVFDAIRTSQAQFCCPRRRTGNLLPRQGMEMPVARMRTPTLCLVPVVLSVVLLIAHAPLFLNDGVAMDDWLVLKMSADYPIDLRFLINGAGHPVFFIYYSIANGTGAPVGVMVAMSIVAILVGAISLALAATRSRLLGRSEAIGVALLVWSYPGYQMWAGKG